MPTNHAAAINEPAEFFISQVIGHKIFDSSGRRVGRLKDLAAVWRSGTPQVVGLAIASKLGVIPLKLVDEFNPRIIRLNVPWDNQQFQSISADQISVNRWLLDKQIIDIRGAKVERVNDIKVRWHHVEGRPRITLMAVDIGLTGILRRLGLNFLAPKAENKLLHWDHFKPLATRTANLEMTIPVEYIADMHPADIADIMQELQPEGQIQVLTALEPETAGLTLAEVDDYARTQLLKALSPEQAHPLINAMDPDDAADNLSTLPAATQGKILDLLEPDQATDISRLMKHPEGTAGSLMTSEYVAFRQDATVSELLAWLQEEQPDFATWNEVFALDGQQSLVGVIPLRTLLLTHHHAFLRDILEPAIYLHPEDGFGKILDISVKYDLMAIPVVDSDQHLLGVVTFDDVLTSLAQNPYNRKFLPHYSVLARLQKRARQ